MDQNPANEGGALIAPPEIGVRATTFKWGKTKYHLTYATHLNYEAYLEFVYSICGQRKLLHYSLINESADVDHPYEHTHVLLHFDKAPNWTSPAKFDFTGRHPNIKPVLSMEHWKNTWRYHEKEGQAPHRSEPLADEIDFHKAMVEYIDGFEGTWLQLLRSEANKGSYIMRNRAWAEILFKSRPTRRTSHGFISVFRPWQQDLVDRLVLPPDDRTIIWVHDAAGRNGKSKLAIYLRQYHGAVGLGGTRADAAHAYNGQPIVLLDLARADGANVDYGLLEKLKDGCLFSSKYQSEEKMFDPPHVVVFSNSAPDLSKFTYDRCHVITL